MQTNRRAFWCPLTEMSLNVFLYADSYNESLQNNFIIVTILSVLSVLCIYIFDQILYRPPILLTANSRSGCVHPQHVCLSKQKACTITVSTIFVCLPADNYDKCAVCTAGTRCWLLQATPEIGPAGSKINSKKQPTGPRESFTMDQAFLQPNP